MESPRCVGGGRQVNACCPAQVRAGFFYMLLNASPITPPLLGAAGSPSPGLPRSTGLEPQVTGWASPLSGLRT